MSTGYHKVGIFTLKLCYAIRWVFYAKSIMNFLLIKST